MIAIIIWCWNIFLIFTPKNYLPREVKRQLKELRKQYSHSIGGEGNPFIQMNLRLFSEKFKK